MSDSIPQDTPQKQCTVCEQYFPATLVYFGAYKRTKDGLRNLCRLCRRSKERGYRQQRLTECREREQRYRETHREDFRRNNEKYMRKESVKVHRAAYMKDYQKKNPHVGRKAQRRYYHNHHQQCLIAMSRYRETHREEMNRKNYLKYWEDVEKTRERHKKYHTPSRRVKKRIWENNRRARKSTNGGEFTLQDIERMYREQKGCCFYCQKDLQRYHIDHVIPISRGGTSDPSNLVLSCPSCNMQKHDRTPEEWRIAQQRRGFIP